MPTSNDNGKTAKRGEDKIGLRAPHDLADFKRIFIIFICLAKACMCVYAVCEANRVFHSSECEWKTKKNSATQHNITLKRMKNARAITWLWTWHFSIFNELSSHQPIVLFPFCSVRFAVCQCVLFFFSSYCFGFVCWLRMACEFCFHTLKSNAPSHFESCLLSH